MIRYEFSIMYMITFFFFGLPILDEICEFDLKNPTPEEEKKLEKDIRFKIPLYICLFIDWLATFFVLKYLVTKEIHLLN